MSAHSTRFDICIVCALAEEAKAFLSQLAQCSTKPLQSAFSQRNREYYHTTIYNQQKEELSLQLTWLPRYGPLETGLHLDALINEFQPLLVAMSGICAGDKQQVQLGDLVVAERAFFYDTGKFVKDAQGNQEHLYDTLTVQLSSEVLQFLRMFDAWIPALANTKRPASKRQQREWLLNELYMGNAQYVSDISFQQLEKYAPDWRKILLELKSGSDPYLTPELSLTSHDSIRILLYQDLFPFHDRTLPFVHFAPIGSGHAVRADDPFADIRVPVRNTAAVDMEGAAFYQTMTNFPSIPALLVKGVCDYADNEKDNSYHEYAARASAQYLLSFICHYMTSERIGNLTKKQSREKKATSEKSSSSNVKNEIGTINGENVSITQGENITYFSNNTFRPIIRKRKQ